MYQILPSNLFLILLLAILSIWVIKCLMSFWFTPKKESKEDIFKKKRAALLKKKILSLFISFDPNSSFFFFPLEINWIVMTSFSMFIFYMFWSIPSRQNVFFSSFLNKLGEQFSIALKSSSDGSKSFFNSIFCLFILTNSMGLIPNVFTSSSHLTFNMFFSFSLWMGFFLFGWWNFKNKMFAHLVPLSTPKPLISFMVLIELISTIIRPGTLSIRLMANMVSGHLLLTLIGNSLSTSPAMFFFFILIAQTLLTSLEMAVSLIQAYVFCMLLTLYSDESDYI